MNRSLIFASFLLVHLFINGVYSQPLMILTNAEQQVTSFAEYRTEPDRQDILLDGQYVPPDPANPLGLEPADLDASSDSNGLSGRASLDSVFEEDQIIVDGEVFQSAVWGQEPSQCHDVHGGSNSSFRLRFRCESPTQFELEGHLAVTLDGYPDLSPEETYAYVKLFSLQGDVATLIWEYTVSGADATSSLVIAPQIQELNVGEYRLEARAEAAVRADPSYPALKSRTASFSFTLSGPYAFDSSPEPDFGIDTANIDLVQVVSRDSNGDGKLDLDLVDINGNGGLDLVVGKPIRVVVPISMDAVASLPKDYEIRILAGIREESHEKSLSIEEWEQEKYVTFTFDGPSMSRDYTLVVHLFPGDAGDSDPANNYASVDFMAEATNDLKVAYFPVRTPEGLSCDLPSYNQTVVRSGDFIRSTYPIADDSYHPYKELTEMGGNTKTLGHVAMIQDAVTLSQWATKLTSDSTAVGAGIVPPDYFDYHSDSGTQGRRYPGIKACLVELDRWIVAAHEVGHVYGLPPGEKEEYGPGDPGRSACGFWVTNNTGIRNGRCFMGNRPTSESFTYLSPKGSFFNEDIWICDKCYVDLFKTFREPKRDPKVLLLAGIIARNGAVELSPLYMMEDCLIHDPPRGDYTVEFLDTEGIIIYSMPFYTDFYAHVDPLGVVETDYAGFALAVPYADDVFRVQLKHNSRVLTSVNPSSRLLRGAVESVPDAGFESPSERRKSLYSKIDEFEAMCEARAFQDAYNKLMKDIKGKIEDWLSNYAKENPGQLTKTEILDLIDEIAGRLVIIGDLKAFDSLIEPEPEPETAPNPDTLSAASTVPENAAPTVRVGSDLRILSSAQPSTVIQGTATDSDGDALDYRWLDDDAVAYGWFPVDGDGAVSLDLANLDYMAVGEHTLTLQVTDGELTSSDSLTLTIESTPPKAEATTPPTPILADVDPIVLRGSVSDFDGDVLEYQWLKYNEILGEGIVETPRGGEPIQLPDLLLPPGDPRFPIGQHEVQLRVLDSTNDPVTASVSIEVVGM